MPSVRELIDSGDVTPRLLAMMQCELVEQLMNVDHTYRLTADNIIVDLEEYSLKLLDCDDVSGNEYSSESDFSQLIYQYGSILLEVITASKYGSSRLHSLAMQCLAGKFASFADIYLMLEKKRSNMVYIPLIVLIIFLLTILALFS